MRHSFTLLFLSLLINYHCNAQNISLTPNGIVVPQVSLQSINDISIIQNPMLSQLIYNTNQTITGNGANGIGFYYWEGTMWKSLTSGSSNNSTLPSSAIIFNEKSGNTSLLNNGFTQIGNTFLPNCDEQYISYGYSVSQTNVPDGRSNAFSVSTGKKAIIWGGQSNSSVYNSGAIFDSESNTWTPTSTINSPSARYDGCSVWTGSKMIVWGGVTSSLALTNTGGIFEPISNTWASITTNNAPSRRFGCSAVWTGKKMIVWGGSNETSYLNDGGIYDPESNTWTSISTTNAPSPRAYHFTAWTGKKMIVWGGSGSNSYTNTGSIYDTETNTWSPMSTINAPTGRANGRGIWTGDRFIIWGNETVTTPQYLSGTGGMYDIESNSWTPTNNSNAPYQRNFQKIAWTGCKLVVWGGSGLSSYFDGRFFDPYKNQWENEFSFTNISFNVCDFVWLDDKFLLWGGFNGTFPTTGAVLNIKSPQPKTFFIYKKN